MTLRALILGGTGFVGPHLARQLADRYEVVCSGRRDDIRDAENVRALVSRARPDLVINLAAITTVKETFDDPRATYDVALFGLLNLFEALKAQGFAGRVLEVSSSEVYGHPASEELPLTETAPLRPLSPYSVAKLSAEALVHQWNHAGHFKVMIARPFTHIGPGQSSRFSVANFASQIAEIMMGHREPVVRVGRLTTTRDLTDVRDVVRAYDAIIHRGRPAQPYNVCSGNETTMRDVLGKLIEHSGVAIEVIEDSGLVRDAEQQRLRGSYAALHSDTGWQPELPLTSTLSDMIRYHVGELSGQPRQSD